MTETLTATLRTNQGDIVVRLLPDHAPKTVRNFVELAEGGRQWTDPNTGRSTTARLYDGTIFHRVIPDFMIQGGDPLGNGGGGPGYTVVEAPPPGTQYVRGVVAMAKTQTDPSGASGSQFFVVTGANVGLPPQYAVAGKVVSGIDVVEKIGSLPTNPPGDGAPTPPVVMSKVTVATS